MDDTVAKLTGVQVIGNDLYLTFNEALDSTTATAINDVAKLLANFAITVNGEDVSLDTTTVACTLTGNGTTQNILKVSLSPAGTNNWDNTKPITVAVKNTATLEGADNVVVATTDAITAK